MCSDGLASYQRRWGRNFESGLSEFAETVQFRDTGKQTAKLTPVWEWGLWRGRDTLANEVPVGTPTGVKLVRSIRRLVLSGKYSKPLFGTVKGTPWSLRGDGQFLPLTVTQSPAQAGAATPPTSTTATQPQATTEAQTEQQAPPEAQQAPTPGQQQP